MATNANSYPLWSASIPLLPKVVEYKFIIRKNGTEEVRWEEIDANRKVDLEHSASDLFLYIDDGVFGKIGQSMLINSKTVQGLQGEIEAHKQQIRKEKEEKEIVEKEKLALAQKMTSLESTINQLKKQIAVLEGSKLETLSTSDLRTLAQKSKKTAHRANVEFVKRVENEIYYLQRSRDCAVCMDKPIDTVCLPCGHVCLSRVTFSDLLIDGTLLGLWT